MEKTFFSRYIHIILIAFTSAIIAHICNVFYYQFIATNQAYAKISQTYPVAQFNELAPKDKIFLNKDPFFRYYICPFIIHNKAIHIYSKEPTSNFWSLAFYTHKGDLVYSLNSELIHHKPLDIILSTPLQLSLVHKYYKDSHIYNADSTLMIARDLTKGLAILRIYAHTPEELKKLQPFISSLACAII